MSLEVPEIYIEDAYKGGRPRPPRNDKELRGDAIDICVEYDLDMPNGDETLKEMSISARVP